MISEELESIDTKTVNLIIKDARKKYEETSGIGQPYSVRHFENLDFVIEYLNKVLDSVTLNRLDKLGVTR